MVTTSFLRDEQKTFKRLVSGSHTMRGNEEY
jgi:hypothetical protein